MDIVVTTNILLAVVAVFMFAFGVWEFAGKLKETTDNADARRKVWRTIIVVSIFSILALVIIYVGLNVWVFPALNLS